VNIVAESTVPEKILLAAYQLEEQGQSPFSAEALVVAAWQKFPRTFGLKGYSDLYPDSNKILTSIMGEKGLARRGWLAKMGQKLYSLTRDGRQVVRRLVQEDETPPGPPPPAKLSREQEKFLLHLLTCSALEKFQQGLKLELTFADACKYWGITENLRGDAVDGRMDRFRTNLAEVDQVVATTGTGVDLSTGRSITADEIRQLHKVDDYLTERFSRHLTLLKNRAERP
jgi:hypothetical protein